MSGDRISITAANSAAYTWNREFFHGQTQKYETENQAAIVTNSNDSGSELIKSFLSVSGRMDTFFGPGSYQILVLEPLCGDCSMDVLEAGLEPHVTRPMALLDDRCRRIHHSEPIGGHKRVDPGPLSSARLLQELRKKASQSTC